MRKLVINICYGGFSLSEEAMAEYTRLGGTVDYDRDIERDDPILIQVVESMGKKANGPYADLCVVQLEKGTLYRIAEYDGFESVETKDTVDWSVA